MDIGKSCVIFPLLLVWYLLKACFYVASWILKAIWFFPKIILKILLFPFRLFFKFPLIKLKSTEEEEPEEKPEPKKNRKPIPEWKREKYLFEIQKAQENIKFYQQQAYMIIHEMEPEEEPENRKNYSSIVSLPSGKRIRVNYTEEQQQIMQSIEQQQQKPKKPITQAKTIQKQKQLHSLKMKIETERNKIRINQLKLEEDPE